MKILDTRYYVLNTSRGQSSLEVLIALTIIVLAISAAIIVGFGNQSAVVDTELNNRALYIAKEELETLRANARLDFGLVASSTSQEGAYTKEVSVTELGTYSKEVAVKITWELSPTQLRELSLETIITDWRTAWEQSGAGDGGGGLEGDWLHPQTAGTIDLSAGNEGTDIAIMGQVVFLTGEASDIKKHDIFSVDVTNINSPQIISSLDTGGGLQSIALWNEYAYVANLSGTEQLQVIDISDPSVMNVIATSTLANNTELPNTIFAKDNYVYIGTRVSSTGAELQIFDVSNPSIPSLEVEVEIGANVNDIYAFKDRLYLATSKSDRELIVYFVLDPENPVQIATLDQASTEGDSVFVTSYSDAYIGMNTIFHTLDTGTLSGISSIDSINAVGDVKDTYVRDYLAFVATDHSNGEFKVYNIDDPANITLQSQFNFSQVATGITYRDNVVYVSVRSNDGLRIITSSD